MNNKGVSLIALTITIIIMIILISIVMTSSEEVKKTQTCEFGNHHYVCAKCGKELNEK